LVAFVASVIKSLAMKSNLLTCVGVLFIGMLALISAAPDSSSLNPSEAARLNNIGCAYMNQQLFEKALASFEEAARRDPNLGVAQLNQGIALASLGRVDAAKKVLDEAAKRRPKDPHVWYALGMLDKNSSNPEGAVEDFRRVIAIDDKDADIWYFLGTAYSQLKQFPQAIDAFEHALQLNPLHASAQFGLSRAYQQSGDSPHAREHLARFQFITQNKLGSAMSLAYGEQGKYSLAEESLGSAMKVSPPIPVKFVDVSRDAGFAERKPLAPIIDSPPSPGAYRLSPGACFLDYDLDGRIDIVLANSRTQGGIVLYHNLGNGKFEDTTEKAGLNRNLDAVSCTAGDYDNDGFPDLALSLGARIVLLHNEKNGTFKDATKESGLEESQQSQNNNESRAKTPQTQGPAAALGVSFVDFDHDGDLDLYVTNFISLGSGDLRITPLREQSPTPGENQMWRNNGNGTFTLATDIGLGGNGDGGLAAVGTDYNNDRAVDIVLTGGSKGATVLENPREGAFKVPEVWPDGRPSRAVGVAVLDFDHDGWMDLAFTHDREPGLTLWRNDHGRAYKQVTFPSPPWLRAYGVAALDYDNDGWVDLVAAGETKDGKGEVRLFRNLGPDGFEDVTAKVGLDRLDLKHPRAILTGDYDNDGATDLLVTENSGAAVLIKNQGGNQNRWLRLVLKGLNDNKSAIGTKVEVFSDGIRQKFELYGSNGYLGQNSPYLTIGLGQAKQPDVVRMLWPTGVLQDEIEATANRQQEYLELDRRGSSCPTLFAWNGKHYELVADVLGAGVVGHWIAPGQRNIPRPTEYLKIPGDALEEKAGQFSFRLMEPMEEVVYIDQVKLLAVDHPANEEVYPNEYFASNPPYPEFKVITSRNARAPAGVWDGQGRDLLPDLLQHKYVGNLSLLPFKGFARPHTLVLDLGAAYDGGPLHLLMHGEIEYFTATGMYAASQAGIEATAPYLEAEIGSGPTRPFSPSKWVRVSDDIGFPAGLPRTITVDLTGKVPKGASRIRITTNLQIYWDSILVDRSQPNSDFALREVPLTNAVLEYHGYPLQIEDQPPGNVKYVYEQVSATGPYAHQAGTYTRYGDVLPLVSAFDDRLVVFGSGEEIQLGFDARRLPALPKGSKRDYFFLANGYEKDMDFYAASGNTVEPLPFRRMGTYPYQGSFPSDEEHLDYLLGYNTRQVSGNEPQSYAYRFADSQKRK
jgi:tetratricopeptide (TPR) repeat protein